MAKKGLLGKIIDAVTEDDGERRERKASGKKHGGLLGKIEEHVTPDKDREERERDAAAQQQPRRD